MKMSIAARRESGSVPVHQCENGLTLRRYWTNACQSCVLKHHCTTGKERRITRWEHEHSEHVQLERCGLKSKFILSGFKKCSTAIRRTMADQSAGDANM